MERLTLVSSRRLVRLIGLRCWGFSVLGRLSTLLSRKAFYSWVIMELRCLRSRIDDYRCHIWCVVESVAGGRCIHSRAEGPTGFWLREPRQVSYFPFVLLWHLKAGEGKKSKQLYVLKGVRNLSRNSTSGAFPWLRWSWDIGVLILCGKDDRNWHFKWSCRSDCWVVPVKCGVWERDIINIFWNSDH
jgi:hypothetical protein